MIPTILFLLMLAYGILIVGIIFKINIMQILASFFLLVLAVEIIPNGIGTIDNVTTLGIGFISIGMGAWHLIKGFGDVEELIKPKEKEEE